MRRRLAGVLPFVLLACPLVSCGGRTLLNDGPDAAARPVPQPHPEVCNGLDDDLDGLVDEDFRDAQGRYVGDQNCGSCGHACTASGPHERAVACTVIDGSPVCAATACDPGYVPSTTGRCVDAYARLCLTCADDGDCGDFDGARCVDVAGDRRCAVTCDLGCPDGYSCSDGVCVPSGGSCSCAPGQHFDVACALHDPSGALCVGHARCDDGVMSACAGSAEICNGVDDDCNGVVDDPFVDARGNYTVDDHNCGQCGIDCTTSPGVPPGTLTCGGDPFAPTCVLQCPDTQNGIQVGDHVDANRQIADGCECTVSSLDDAPGPVGAVGQNLDTNCDGADGIVVKSFYVAPDGDDSGPGSPTRPLRTIGAAVARAAASLDTATPRPNVFVASGTYTETVDMPDGVRVYGGYRRDFLALDPSGLRVDVRAPADTQAPGGAALVVRGAGSHPTVVRWLSVHGLDATGPSSAAFGAVLIDPGPQLALRDMEIRSGTAGAGMDGADGIPGAVPNASAAAGDPPRAAVEDANHQCIPSSENVVAGGVGGQNVCMGGADVRGGTGGSPHCPVADQFEPSGADGLGLAATPGGAGGAGGQDSSGPVQGPGCPVSLCCGLADFNVAMMFSGPEPGQPGRDGRPGTAGQSCNDPFGQFEGDAWVPGTATSGTQGSAGSGGGGGGAGGGTEMTWYAFACPYPDGLGGGGGGGGAGGCGGGGGGAATSGGPSVAVLVRYTAPPTGALPTIDGVTIGSGAGGRAGDGGAGGEGGAGGPGALGGALPRQDRTTPTLAGPFPGEQGGPGGSGGPGGGGGAGCGGGSVGIWLTGPGQLVAPPSWAGANDFQLGSPGAAGRGGSGGAPASDGAAGGAQDVLVR